MIYVSLKTILIATENLDIDNIVSEIIEEFEKTRNVKKTFANPVSFTIVIRDFMDDIEVGDRTYSKDISFEHRKFINTIITKLKQKYNPCYRYTNYITCTNTYWGHRWYKNKEEFEYTHVGIFDYDPQKVENVEVQSNPKYELEYMLYEDSHYQDGRIKRGARILTGKEMLKRFQHKKVVDGLIDGDVFYISDPVPNNELKIYYKLNKKITESDIENAKEYLPAL